MAMRKRCGCVGANIPATTTLFPWVTFARMRSLHPRLCSCHHYVVLLVVVAFPWVMFARMRSLHPRLGSLRPYRAKFLPPLRGSVCIGLSYRGLRSRVCAHCTHGCVPATTTWFYWLLLRFRGLCSRVCAHCTHGWVPCAPTGLNSCHHYVAKFLPPLRGSVCIDLSYRGLCSRLCTHCTHGCVPCAAMGLYLFLPVADGSYGKDADDGKNGEKHFPC